MTTCLDFDEATAQSMGFYACQYSINTGLQAPDLAPSELAAFWRGWIIRVQVQIDLVDGELVLSDERHANPIN
jgi:hypothetical protein